MLLQNFLQQSGAVTIHQSSSGSGDQITLSILRDASKQKQTIKHIGPLLLCRPFCLVILVVQVSASLPQSSFEIKPIFR